MRWSAVTVPDPVELFIEPWLDDRDLREALIEAENLQA